ncbi:hypothetical protein GQ602_005980 [Ophiocordyceps camponoti-floridani]|uniref:Heme haloperoxidase family profile domain-containing protein n=1 Tax=Ophiocordyceps camponoti-floridani TaxID=2030778 RepID=A0A8H4VBG9_9HYPO|nr:hypothetical protein GQ602_005980 [Ophiocordyceps camponoti-floridani]
MKASSTTVALLAAAGVATAQDPRFGPVWVQDGPGPPPDFPPPDFGPPDFIPGGFTPVGDSGSGFDGGFNRQSFPDGPPGFFPPPPPSRFPDPVLPPVTAPRQGSPSGPPPTNAPKRALQPPAGVCLKPRPNDIRGPCPGLNALANCGWLSRDGRSIGMPEIMTAASRALHLDPQTIALVVAGGIVTRPGNKPLVIPRRFDLRAVGFVTWGILHDCCFTRPDRGGPATGFFRPLPDVWMPALMNLIDQGAGLPSTEELVIDVPVMARAKQARIEAGCNYTVTAAAHGSVEMGMLLCALGGDKATTNINHVRSIMEDEIIPGDLPERPPMSCGVETIVSLASQALQSNRRLRMANNGNINNTDTLRADIGHGDTKVLLALRADILNLGFGTRGVTDIDKRIRAQGFAGRL